MGARHLLWGRSHVLAVFRLFFLLSTDVVGWGRAVNLYRHSENCKERDLLDRKYLM